MTLTCIVLLIVQLQAQLALSQGAAIVAHQGGWHRAYAKNSVLRAWQLHVGSGELK